MGVDAEIRDVERGLLPAIRIRGRAAGPFLLGERMTHHGVPGVSLALIEGGRIAWARAYGRGDAGSGTPMRPSSLFQAASISKPVTALAVLRLVEARTLDLDRPVNQRLRSWRVPDNEHTRRDR